MNLNKLRKQICSTVLLSVMIVTTAACTSSYEHADYEASMGTAHAEIINQDCAKDVESEAQTFENVYRLAASDELTIKVYDEPALSGKYALSGEGKIAMPLIGDVSLYGCTIAQAQKTLTKHYKDGYLLDPNITIEIANYRPFYILGEVKAPGRYEYAADLSVLKAAALAGGFTYRANKSEALISRQGDDKDAKLYKVEADIMPGDVITIRERLF